MDVWEGSAEDAGVVLRTSPRQRLAQLVWTQGEVEPVLKWMAAGTAEPLSDSLRVAVIAAARNFCAPRNGIPRRVCPFDAGP
jgi:hypothetical protein